MSDNFTNNIKDNDLRKERNHMKKSDSDDLTENENLYSKKDSENESEDDESDLNENDSENDSENEDTDEELDDDDIWTINPKLFSYYEKQFKTMQPNLNGFILGSVAKPFFERSKLPLNELSKIWELSDVSKDGALSFAEFCTAMHLVVLRVRNFDIPDELPAKLQPNAHNIENNFNSFKNKSNTTLNENLLQNLSDSDESTISSNPYAPLIDFNSETNLNSENNSLNHKTNLGLNENLFKNHSDLGEPILGSQAYAPLIDFNSETSLNNQNNNLFGNKTAKTIVENSMKNNSDLEDSASDSPVQISSQSKDQNETKPLNFGVKPQIKSDLQIAHPVAVRLNSNQTANFSNNAHTIPEPPPRHSRSSSLGAVNQNNGINLTNNDSFNSNLIPPPPASAQTSHLTSNMVSSNTPKILKQQPTVPPRITSPSTMSNQTHQSLNQTQPVNDLPPPPPPPLPTHHNYHKSRILSIQQHQHQHNQQTNQIVETTNSSNRAPLSSNLSNSNQSNFTNNLQLEDVTKSFQKLIENLSSNNLNLIRKLSEAKPTSQENLDDQELLIESIKTQTEHNQALKKVFNELEKELRSLTDQRIALEIKLDYLNTATINAANSNLLSNSMSTPSISLVSNTPIVNQHSSNQLNTKKQLNQNNLSELKAKINDNENINQTNNVNSNIVVIQATPILSSIASTQSTPMSSNHPSMNISATPITTNSISTNLQTAKLNI